MNSNLKKYALVTGGSSGMGLEYVKSLARRGYNVIIVALFQNETDAVKEEMAKLYPELDFISIGMDLSTMEAPSLLYEQVRDKIGEGAVEVLVNNAGVINPMHFRNMT
ncbi:MAG: SDR family NAD(P)-dependent oxidoreductase, partial [Bacteroidales bacterium]|nr:SDR family NAD(P)-dependent oxidoreductase [Bacteroidales bacterium]